MHDNQRQTHWAYIAGIMDADGCFMIGKYNRKTKTKTTERAKNFPRNLVSWSPVYLPTVKIAMIEPEAINFIMQEFNLGSVALDGARKDRPNGKPIFHWYIRSRFKIVTFLEGVIPYLKVKKNRAEHLLEFAKHLQENGIPGYKGTSDAELNYREQAYVKMREFNGNKVAATTKSFRRESVSDSLNKGESL